jgi:hypothetical protein
MKFPEALELGSVMWPQGFGAMQEGGLCALGTAMAAVGRDPAKWYDAYKYFPELLNYATCPVGGCASGHGVLFGVAFHLNDYHKWTRPQIAAWVATIEPQESEHAGRGIQAGCAGGAERNQGAGDEAGQAAERPQAYRDAGAVAGAVASGV